MKKYLSGYVEVNDIPVQEPILEAGDFLLDHKETTIHNFSRFGYILEGFQQLLTDQIDVEKFFLLGGVESQDQPASLTTPPAEALFALQEIDRTHPEQLEDAMIIVDKQAMMFHRNESGQERFDHTHLKLVVL